MNCYSKDGQAKAVYLHAAKLILSVFQNRGDRFVFALRLIGAEPTKNKDTVLQDVRSLQ